MKKWNFRYIRAIKLVAGISGAYIFVGGCSGLDDLRLHNNYDFAMTLSYRYKDGNNKEAEMKYEPVAAHKDARFRAAGGYHGNSLEQMHVLNESGKDLGILKKIAKKMDEAAHSACNGTTVWDVTVGP